MEKANPSGETNSEEEFWTLSGTKPFFNVIISKSNLSRRSQLKLPVKIQTNLPSLTIPVVLAYGGKEWCLMYNGITKKFNADWKNFALDNGLKIGDACVFELQECDGDANAKIVFRVQIFRGQIPPEMALKFPGSNANNPISLM